MIHLLLRLLGFTAGKEELPPDPSGSFDGGRAW